jgi:Tol biopolymer transport system component
MRPTNDLRGVEIGILNPSSGRYRRLTQQPIGAFGSLAWSPDGSLLAYSRTQRNGHRAIVVLPVTGKGRARAVPGTRGGEWPVFSPDGSRLAFARYRAEGGGEGRLPTFESSSVWLVDLKTGVRRQLTRWRKNLWQYPSSFSPDGMTLLLSRLDFQRSVEDEIVALHFDGRTSGLLVGEGDEPMYSPDGTKIVYVNWREPRVWSPKRHKWVFQPTSDLYIVNADGSHRRRLTRTPHLTELLGGWDPSSERIVYTRFKHFPYRHRSTGTVMEANADGTCPRGILSVPGVFYVSPVWQPGPGRGTGPIRC